MRLPSSPVPLALAVYLLLTVVLTWPLVLHPGTVVPNDLGDSLLNMFLMSWNARVMPLTARWWDAPQFFPLAGVTAFSEHLLGLSIITTPIVWLTGNVLVAYNAAFFLSFPLCALSAYWLGYEITRRHDAAFVAGLAFAFAPYRMAQFAHIQVLSAYWMPVALAALHRYLHDGRARWLAIFGIGWAMQALACGYYFFYLSTLVALWLLWFGNGKWRPIVRVLAAWAVAALALAPVMYGYWFFQRAYGLRRGIDEIRAFSADLASLLSAPANVRLWGWLNVVDRPESALFPGVAILVLIALALGLRSDVEVPPRGRVRGAWIALALAVVFGVIALTPALVGSWKLDIGSLRLLSVSSANKPLSVCLFFAAVAALVHPAFRSAWRRRSPTAFYVLAAVAMWILSLGPTPTLMNRPLLYMAPYAWLMRLPGLDGVRVPARFWLLATLCLAAAAGLAVRRLSLRWPRRQPAIVAAASVALLLDGWPTSMPLEPRPDPRPNRSDAVARLDLPLDPYRDLIAIFWAVDHRRPVFNGYSGYGAPHYVILRDLLLRHEPFVLSRLADVGPYEVVIDLERDEQHEWRGFVGAHPGAQLVGGDGASVSYRIPGSSTPQKPAVLTSPALRPASISATVRPDLVGDMTDGNLITRWHAGRPQAPGDSFTVDLGETRQVDGVELQIAGYTADYPRALRIETSEDGQSWIEAWHGSGAVVALSAALEHPGTIPLTFALPPRPARYVRCTELGREVVFYWTVAELRITGR